MNLKRALLVSIALHSLLLFSLPERQSITRKNSDPLLLVARLAQATVAEERVAAPQRLAKPAPAKRKLASVTPLVEPMPPLVPLETRSEESQASPASAQTEQVQFDPNVIAQYRLSIISAARQFRRYPPLARDNSWQGRAEVRVSFDGARQPALIISRSSGYAVLDRQAVETLSKALAPLPPMLLGRSFELDFPVVFSLQD